MNGYPSAFRRPMLPSQPLYSELDDLGQVILSTSISSESIMIIAIIYQVPTMNLVLYIYNFIQSSQQPWKK